MKPFDLAKALAGDKVISRTGFNVKIVCQSEKNSDSLLCVYEFDNHDFATWINNNGKHCVGGISDNDLFMQPIIKTYWANIYRYALGTIHLGELYSNLETAITQKFKEHLGGDYLKTISFEVEE